MGRRLNIRDDSAEVRFQSFLQGRLEQFWRGQGRALFDVVRPAFPLPTTASPALQRALKDGFGEAVLSRVPMIHINLNFRSQKDVLDLPFKRI